MKYMMDYADVKFRKALINYRDWLEKCESDATTKGEKMYISGCVMNVNFVLDLFDITHRVNGGE